MLLCKCCLLRLMLKASDLQDILDIRKSRTKTMKILRAISVIVLLIFPLAHAGLAQGIILPLPSKPTDQSAQPQPEEKQPESKTSGPSPLLPLPKTIGDGRPTQQQKPEQAKEVIIPVIPESLKPNLQKTSSSDNFPSMPDEIIVHSSDALDDLIPAVSLPTTSSDSEFPIFPKDTSSAIFMIMKTWQCENYDGNTLLSHAVEVYGGESVDPFQVLGLVEDPGFYVTLFEEDITLDELLDILASISGRDWGVDIPGRTIYFYPQGVDTNAASPW